jgi:hypothetical protein
VGADKKKVQRALKELSDKKIAEQPYSGAPYRLTKKGKDAAADLRAAGGFPAFGPSGAERRKELLEGMAAGKAMCLMTGQEASIGGEK